MPRKPYRERYAEYIAALPPGTPLLDIVRNAPDPTDDEMAAFLELSDIAYDPAEPPDRQELALAMLAEAMPGRMLAPNFDPNPGRLTYHQARAWEQQQAARLKLGLSTEPLKAKPKRPAPVTAHGNREGLDGVLRAVLDSKATSKNTYEDWQKVQPPQNKRPTWSTFQRQTRQHRNAGETAWDTAYRLAQEKRKREKRKR